MITLILLQNAPKPQLCRENFLINELIREYLIYNQYNYTHSVLVAGKDASGTTPLINTGVL